MDSICARLLSSEEHAVEDAVPQVAYDAVEEIQRIHRELENAKEDALHAAFFNSGLYEAGYDACIEAWGEGCIELAILLVSYAPLTTRLCNAVAEVNDHTFPGVFDYEVSGPFGKWFAVYIIDHGVEPTKETAESWLAKEIEAFFSQGASPEEKAAIQAAIAKEMSKQPRQ